MEKNINEIQDTIAPFMEDLISKYKIKLIYIFSSYAKGKNNETSDLDMAIYLENEADGFVKLSILDELVGIFNREDIALVILNNADKVIKKFGSMSNIGQGNKNYKKDVGF